MKQGELLKAIKDTLSGKHIDTHGGEGVNLQWACELLLEYVEKESQLNKLRLKYAILNTDIQSASGKAYRELRAERNHIFEQMEELE